MTKIPLRYSWYSTNSSLNSFNPRSWTNISKNMTHVEFQLTSKNTPFSALLPIIGNIGLVKDISEIVEDAIDREKLLDKAKQKAIKKCK